MQVVCRLVPALTAHRKPFPPEHSPLGRGRGSPRSHPDANGDSQPWIHPSCWEARSSQGLQSEHVWGCTQQLTWQSIALQLSRGSTLGLQMLLLYLWESSLVLSELCGCAGAHGLPTTGSSKNLQGFSQHQGEMLRTSREGRARGHPMPPGRAAQPASMGTATAQP